EKTYLNRAAVEALGSAGAVAPEQRARVIAYLQARLADDDAMIVCAAVRSLGSLQGAAAVPALAAVIRDNRQRPDGHGEMVCTAAVNALGQTGSAQAGPALAAELGRSEDKGWSLEYGSRVLAALVRTNAPEGPAAALAYAERLSARLTGNGMARKHLEARIAEARAAAAGRGFEGM
ncbi:MAG TPA: hypothetical protein PK280_12235, partial [Planctomycetota bacterium]|nr:hypothetical protein [Planctomycetota bacterium]